MQLLPVDTRKAHWTRGLAQMCQLLEHHEYEEIAHIARFILLLIAGEVEVDTTKKRGRPSTPSKVTPPSKKASEGLGGSRVHFARNGEISGEDGESSDDQV